MSMIDDIKRDAEAGTPGPWVFEAIDGDWTDAHMVKGSNDYIVCCNTRYYPTEVSVGDQKRIARVPSMEAALIAAEAYDAAMIAYENAEQLAGDTQNPVDYEDVLDCWNKVKAAQAAYRAATGGDT